MKYIIGIDQSTQGTKAVLFNESGDICGRADRAHRQLINDKGWVSHDLSEIYENTKFVIRQVIEQVQIDKGDVAALGISNQRESTAAFFETGVPALESVVWQCARAESITQRHAASKLAILDKTGLPLSPYFPAAKMCWLKEFLESERDVDVKNLKFGTMDTWLIYKMTNGRSYKTDYSNASRTQLFNLHTLSWDPEICALFGIPISSLPEVCDSDSLFGMTDLEGYFSKEIPIHSAIGDSHAALFGQGCHKSGMVKTTYGTGSSIMMHVGEHYIQSQHGLAASLAWARGGVVEYVLEGNINYTGAVITWLKNEMELITSPGESETLAKMANPEDETVLVPAFSGLGAPYWVGDAKASIYGMSRLTGKKELIKASLESIGFQINDVLSAMTADFGEKLMELRVDGGATSNHFLMQFQSDIADVNVSVAADEELSAIGAAYMAGTALGIYDNCIFNRMSYETYTPKMSIEERNRKNDRWKDAVRRGIM
ncbi:MAG: FGGY-family carbohydrate kinase [Lachnospiraceae bacterium]